MTLTLGGGSQSGVARVPAPLSKPSLTNVQTTVHTQSPLNRWSEHWGGRAPRGAAGQPHPGTCEPARRPLAPPATVRSLSSDVAGLGLARIWRKLWVFRKS